MSSTPSKRDEFTNEQIVELYKQVGHKYELVAKAIGITRVTFFNWRQKDAELANALNEADMDRIDRFFHNLSVYAEGIPEVETVEVQLPNGDTMEIEKIVGWKHEPNVQAAKVILGILGHHGATETWRATKQISQGNQSLKVEIIEITENNVEQYRERLESGE